MHHTILVLLVYAAVMLLSTVLMTKREKSVEGFCVGNRNIGWFVSALSIAATWIWAPALFTSTENAYTKGFAGLFWFLVPNVLCLIFFIPFAKKIRKEMPEGITLSGYMHQKYKSEHVKSTYLFQLGALSVLSTGVQLLAGSKILSMLTGVPFWMMTVIMAVIAYAYSQFSGIKASILTDSIQMVFMLITSICFMAFGVRNGGGVENLLAGLGGVAGDSGSLISDKGIEIFFGFGLPTAIGLISGPFGDQSFWQRVFCVRKDRIGRAFFLGAVLFGIVPLSMGILGFVGAGMGYVVNDTVVINFELISALFPAWAVIPFLFMIVSGLLSTIDSNLCAVSSLTIDIFKDKTLGKTKLTGHSVAATLDVLVTPIVSLTKTSSTITASGTGGSGSGTVTFAASADGRFVDSPMMSWIGEDGPEFVVPVGAKRRQRGIELWQQAGEMLGVGRFADGGLAGGRFRRRDTPGHSAGIVPFPKEKNLPVWAGQEDSGADRGKADTSPGGSTESGNASGGGIKIEVNLNPTFQITESGGNGTDDSSVVAMIQSRLREMADDLAGEIADKLEGVFGNMPKGA